MEPRSRQNSGRFQNQPEKILGRNMVWITAETAAFLGQISLPKFSQDLCPYVEKTLPRVFRGHGQYLNEKSAHRADISPLRRNISSVGSFIFTWLRPGNLVQRLVKEVIKVLTFDFNQILTNIKISYSI